MYLCAVLRGLLILVFHINIHYCIRLFGWLRGTPLVNVSDLEVALAVLRASNNKVRNNHWKKATRVEGGQRARYLRI